MPHGPGRPLPPSRPRQGRLVPMLSPGACPVPCPAGRLAATSGHLHGRTGPAPPHTATTPSAVPLVHSNELGQGLDLRWWGGGGGAVAVPVDLPGGTVLPSPRCLGRGMAWQAIGCSS